MSTTSDAPSVDAPNAWRLDSPGHTGWQRTARPEDPNKYFMVSADCHANEPSDLWVTRMDKRYEHRLSRQPVHEHLICLECGKVIEFESAELWQVETRVRSEHGFMPARHRLEIYGLCRECQEAGVALPYQGITCPIETV